MEYIKPQVTEIGLIAEGRIITGLNTENTVPVDPDGNPEKFD